jgi:hypothetical protein
VTGAGVAALGADGAAAGGRTAAEAAGAGEGGTWGGAVAVGGATAGLAAAGGTAAGPGGADTAGGVPGRIRADLAAASRASLSARAFSSAAASASAMPFRCLRTFSATSSGIELECVFFSVTPYPGKRSMMAFAFTSSSRASSLIRTWFASVMRPISPSYAGTFVS